MGCATQQTGYDELHDELGGLLVREWSASVATRYLRKHSAVWQKHELWLMAGLLFFYCVITEFKGERAGEWQFMCSNCFTVGS